MGKIKRYNFSLIELLAAVSIFAILMVIVMNMFSSAMVVLSKNSGYTKMSAAVQTAFDYLEERLVNCDEASLADNFSSAECIPVMEDSNSVFTMLTSVDISNENLNQQRVGKLYLALDRGINGRESDWSLDIMFNIDSDGDGNFEDNDGDNEYEEDYIALLSNVTSFKLTALKHDGTERTSNSDQIKYIRIDLEMLSPEDFESFNFAKMEQDDFEAWLDDEQNRDFYNDKVYQFSRIVTLP